MTARRKSLRDLDNDALDHTPVTVAAVDPEPVAEAAPAPTKARTPRPGRTTTATAKAAAKKPSRVTGSTVGVYMQRPTFDAARSAYMADLDTLATGPDTLARWVDAALAAYAALDASERVAIADTLPAEDRTEARGINRTFQVGADTIEKVNAALVADRQAGRWRSRSVFAVEAIQWAINAAKERAGGVLPEAPPRLPNRAMR